MKLAPTPFSNEGSARWPYWALVTNNSMKSKSANFVCKRFKVPVGVSEALVHNRERYVEQMEIQAICVCLAREYNKAGGSVADEEADKDGFYSCKEDASSLFKKIAFTMVTLLDAKTSRQRGNHELQHGEGASREFCEVHQQWCLCQHQRVPRHATGEPRVVLNQYQVCEYTAAKLCHTHVSQANCHSWRTSQFLKAKHHTMQVNLTCSKSEPKLVHREHIGV